LFLILVADQGRGHANGRGGTGADKTAGSGIVLISSRGNDFEGFQSLIENAVDVFTTI